jgi:hypothetical protein
MTNITLYIPLIFHIADGFITPITIKPCVLDIEQTEGLCGYISKTKNMSDDFMPRGKTNVLSVAMKGV